LYSTYSLAWKKAFHCSCISTV